MSRKRVYIAGKLNDVAPEYIKNVHNMMYWAEQVRKFGFAVYIPGIDLLMGLTFGNWEYEDYFDNSQAWLDVSDCMFVTPGWETSSGTIKEISRCNEKGIPVYYDIETMVKNELK